MTRFILFIAINIFITLAIVLICSALGITSEVERGASGEYVLQLESIAIISLLWGFLGAFISLALSRKLAKWSYNIQVIEPNTASARERELLQRVYHFAQRAGLRTMPQVGIYHNPNPNAFATGPSKRSSLVAVSTGLLEQMNKNEVDGVLAHEVAHIANGDMVTMTLLQGVINTFVIFLSKTISWVIALRMRSNDKQVSRMLQFSIEIVLHIVLGIIGMLIMCWFSRYREYRADAGGAQLAGTQSMKAALQKLLDIEDRRNVAMQLPEHQQEQGGLLGSISNRKSNSATACLHITGDPKRGRNYLVMLFSTHPALEDRIQKLSSYGG